MKTTNVSSLFIFDSVIGGKSLTVLSATYRYFLLLGTNGLFNLKITIAATDAGGVVFGLSVSNKVLSRNSQNT